MIYIVKIACSLKSLQVLVFMDLGVGVRHKENCVPGGLKQLGVESFVFVVLGKQDVMIGRGDHIHG